MKSDKQRFVFRSYRTQDNPDTIFQSEMCNILDRIWTDGGFWQLFIRDRKVVQDNSCIKGNYPIWRSDQRIDIALFDPGKFGDELGKMDHDLFQLGQIDRFFSPHALQSFINPGLLHHPFCKSGCEWRNADSLIFYHFNKLPAKAKEDNRTKLRIDNAAEDQLIA